MELPNRQTIRKKGWDYAAPAHYFVTLNTHDNRPLFGTVVNGSMLILSPFDDAAEAPNARRAVWCNQYVLAHCDHMVIGHLNPDGVLACILSESHPELAITYL